MLSQVHQDIVKSTTPILREHGVALADHFYKRLFTHNPELKPMFNQGHQSAGTQQQALAFAVAAYAENINDPSVLAPVLKMICNKHASLGIRAEHYPIIGGHLLNSICEVLSVAFVDPLIEAWGAAYNSLANVLIKMEDEIYHQTAAKQGGWTGWRPFNVVRKIIESDNITSFYFEPADGGKISSYLSGQYISLNIFVPQLNMMQSRQYTVSQAFDANSLRISIKREEENTTPAGMISNQMHDTIDVGAKVDLSAPQGEFYLSSKKDTPVVFISAGVGITPMIAMTESALRDNPERKIVFAHACMHGGVHAFKIWLKEKQSKYSNTGNESVFFSHICYENPQKSDSINIDFDTEGRLKIDTIFSQFPQNADYYLCGPLPFMQEQQKNLLAAGIDINNIQTEIFGSGVV